MSDLIFDHPLWDSITQNFQSHDVALEGAWSSSIALLIAALQKKLHKSVLIVTADRSSTLVDNLPTFGIPAYELPAWEVLPGEDIPPSPDIMGRRLEIFYNLISNPQCVVVTSMQSLLQKVTSQELLVVSCDSWKVGGHFKFDKLPFHLESLGYKRVAVVTEKGEYALRSGICDLFPITLAAPVRIEFFGDTIETLRCFDPMGQKTIERIQEFLLTPVSEKTLLSKESSLKFLTEYLPSDTILVFDDLEILEDQLIELKKLSASSHSPFFGSQEELFEKLKTYKKVFFAERPLHSLFEDAQFTKKTGTNFSIEEEIHFSWCHHSFSALKLPLPVLRLADALSFIENTEASSYTLSEAASHFLKQGGKVHFLSSSDAETQSLKEKLHPFITDKQAGVYFERGYLSHGFVLPKQNLAYIPYTEFSRQLKIRRPKWRLTMHAPPSEFHTLEKGDFVVHFHHGIGKFLGIEKKPNNQGQPTEFLVLEYASKSILYVPIQQAHLVSRYIGAKEEVPSFSVLGSNKWQKTKLLAQKSIIGYAEQLLRRTAERQMLGGFAYPEDGPLLKKFEEDFPFVLTDDQARAIDAIGKDMCQPTSMDRLICGDVGYGKTEVAMWAAFKAVADGKKQVAMLVPTTVLALQHYESFCARMANFTVTIRCLSRFNTPKENKAILQETKEGKVDILIGTHRILSKDVIFKELGLIIVDEEQRFGVRAKEALKAFKTGVDALTLTATPIPRTLYMTITGIKEISVINTPPQDRLPIKSLVVEKDDDIIEQAILRELSRGGQIFFIHNRIDGTYQIKERLNKLVPAAKIGVSHGQMDPDEIDLIFHAFKKAELDILVATTIVENGIDIPNANTILIDHADQYGLADLYQLRGRVGRWNRPAFAYFLIPKGKTLLEVSQKRLEAMLSASGYGGGLKIAMRDLEIRGAGDVLGVQQSGHVAQVGFHLYCKLLKKTIDAMQKKKTPTFIETKMEFPFPAELPDDYIPETSLRMEFYHRLGEAISNEEVDAIYAELKDRFGKLPEKALWLYHLTRIKIFASMRQFVLVKIEGFFLTAERQKGKENIKKSFSFAKSASQNPALLEQEVLKILQENFF